ncbi:MAG: inositol monophosphatase, partial [Ignavibacteriales bacterium]|nr:inositol monophosphatase [Ignavibacteriales bacterium]
MINKVIQISKEAGEIVREGFGKNFSIEYKTNVSNLVTEIDKKSEALIIDFIKKEFPTHS